MSSKDLRLSRATTSGLLPRLASLLRRLGSFMRLASFWIVRLAPGLPVLGARCCPCCPARSLPFRSPLLLLRERPSPDRLRLELFLEKPRESQPTAELRAPPESPESLLHGDLAKLFSPLLPPFDTPADVCS